MYINGVVHDVFYHCNDDAIKIYHSGVTASRLTIWKILNDPIIQVGWPPRDLHDVTIDSLYMYIIHTRFRKRETHVPSAIIGASPIYNGETRLDPSMTISGISVSNIIREALCPGLFRLTPLQNYADFTVSGVKYVDGLIGGSVPIGDSIIALTTDTTYPGAEGLTVGLSISDWAAKGEKVGMENAGTLGQWDANAAYNGQWSIA
ncbi:glycoside hydrolase [Aspergillus carlsbadensis]|nr:glycoside hydrolase [Aspergillus carlsbadensis]